MSPGNVQAHVLRHSACVAKSDFETEKGATTCVAVRGMVKTEFLLDSLDSLRCQLRTLLIASIAQTEKQNL